MTNELFKMVRLYLGLTQHEFADYIGIKPGTIAKIETNYTKVSERNKAKVFRKFNPADTKFIEFVDRMKAIG